MAEIPATLPRLAERKRQPASRIGERGERNLEFERVNVYRLRDGKITETSSYDADPYEPDELWS